MAQVFDDKGRVTPVTIIRVLPVTVTQTKSLERDAYVATQVGYGVQKESRVNKAQIKKGNFMGFKEIRHEGNMTGDLEKFEAGDSVQISGISKGKGFQGVVKRHGFHGGPRTHGQKHSEREAGSIGGAGRAGGRVVKGMRMAGRMGGDRVTVKNLKVVQIEGDEILISGAVPGRRGTLLEIKSLSSKS